MVRRLAGLIVILLLLAGVAWAAFELNLNLGWGESDVATETDNSVGGEKEKKDGKG